MHTTSLLHWLCAATLIMATGACAEGSLDAEATGGAGPESGGSSAGGTGSGGDNAAGGATTGGSGGYPQVGGGGGSTSTGGTGGGTGGSIAQSGGSAGGTGVEPPEEGLTVYLTPATESNKAGGPLRLENRGSTAVDLNTITMRYWLSSDGLPLSGWVLECYWMSDAHGGCGNVLEGSGEAVAHSIDTGDPTADTYIEIAFAGQTLNGGDELQLNFDVHQTDWAELNKANDYSTTTVAGYTDKITVYQSGQLVWGVEPVPAGQGGAPGAGGTAGAAGGPASGGAAGTAAAGAPAAGGMAGTAGAAGSSGAAGAFGAAGTAGAAGACGAAGSSGFSGQAGGG